MLKITSESGVSAGVRRIEAVTGVGANLLLDELSQNYSAITNELFIEDIDSRDGVDALDYLRFLEEENISFAKALNCSNDQVLKKIIQIKEENNDLLKELNRGPLEFKILDTCIEAIENLMNTNKSLKKEAKQLQSEDIGSSIQALIDSSLLVEGYQLISSTFEDTDSKELREIADRLRNKNENSIIVLISISEDKEPSIVSCSKDVDIDAREIMKHLINQLGGSGGGRSDFAQGGVENTNDLAYKHTKVAEGITEQAYQNTAKNLYGIVYDFQGNTATAMQFYLTDSIKHFVRGALYFETEINDSIIPINNFLKDDIYHLIESWEWKN